MVVLLDLVPTTTEVTSRHEAEPAYLVVGRTTTGVQRTGERIALGVEIWSGSATERLVGTGGRKRRTPRRGGLLQASPRRTISTNALRMM
jgi:hypothetical protein